MWILVERGRVAWHVRASLDAAHLGAGAASPCSPALALELFRRLRTDAAGMVRLRRLLADHLGRAGLRLSLLSDDKVRADIARLVAVGRVRVAEWAPGPAPDLGLPGEEECRPEELPQTLASIVYQVVDDLTHEPIADVSLIVTLPDGSEVPKKTNRDGIVQFDGLRAGRCGVRAELGGRDLLHVLAFDGFGQHPIGAGRHDRRTRLWERPAFDGLERAGKRKPEDKPPVIATVLAHRVRTGETLASVAEVYETTQEALMEFNFGTTDHDAVQRLLASEVGCAVRDLESGDYVLSSADDPGILYIPRAWERFGQATDREWVIRVHRIQPEPPPFVFSL